MVSAASLLTEALTQLCLQKPWLEVKLSIYQNEKLLELADHKRRKLAGMRLN